MGRNKDQEQGTERYDYHDRLLTRHQVVAARTMLHLTTEKVAEITCMSKTTINNIEGGNTPKPQRRTFVMLKQTFEKLGVEFGVDGWVRLSPKIIANRQAGVDGGGDDTALASQPASALVSESRPA